jgi:glycine/serine hydroxymethyltransferase
MREVGELIVSAIEARDDRSKLDELSARVHDICARFPVPGLPRE